MYGNDNDETPINSLRLLINGEKGETNYFKFIHETNDNDEIYRFMMFHSTENYSMKSFKFLSNDIGKVKYFILLSFLIESELLIR